MSDAYESSQDPIQPEDRLKDAIGRLDRDYIDVGRELFMTFSSGRFKAEGYNSFDTYARRKLGMDPGRARRLRRVFKVFQRDLGVPKQRLSEIGYEKAIAIMPVIRRESAAVWLARAETLSYEDLTTLIDAEKPKRKKRRVVVQPPGSDPQTYKPVDPKTPTVSMLDEKQKPSADGKYAIGQDETVYEKTFYLIGDQAMVVETALEEVERQTGSDKPGYLLCCALIEFLALRATKEVGDDGRLKHWLSLLEQRYGGKLLWIKDGNVASKMTELLAHAEDTDDTASDGPSD